MKTRIWLIVLLCLLSFLAGALLQNQRLNMMTMNASSEGGGVLKQQQDDWNAGNLDGFLSGYDMSDDITFFTDDNVTKGWVAISDRYRKSRSKPGLMGKLDFSELSVKPLSPEYALARGRWTVTECEKPGTGLFTVLIRKTDAGYKIVHDHTSEKKKE